jgi:hypothetical protein
MTGFCEQFHRCRKLVPQPRPITRSTPLRVLDLPTPAALGGFRALRDRKSGGLVLLREAKRAGRLRRC